jgi:S1-C subfamily serine protease
VYVGATVFVLTLLFNARQEACGPANSGWIPSWPSMKVAGVTPGGPMDKAGLRAGDVLEAAGGQPLTGMPDWFVARAHFERDRPIDLQIQRDGQHLCLHLVITDPSFRTWNKAQRDGVLALYVARLILLLLAMLVAFSRC